MENKKIYLVRGDKSGVFFGEIEERSGQEVKMRNVRRIWYWDGACSLSQLATDGTARPNNCTFTVYVDEITILDAIEILTCTEKAIKSIRSVEKWKY